MQKKIMIPLVVTLTLAACTEQTETDPEVVVPEPPGLYNPLLRRWLRLSQGSVGPLVSEGANPAVGTGYNAGSDQ